MMICELVPPVYAAQSLPGRLALFSRRAALGDKIERLIGYFFWRSVLRPNGLIRCMSCMTMRADVGPGGVHDLVSPKREKAC